MRKIGLHVRITNSIMQTIDYAQELDIPIFQCFLVNQANRKPLKINATIGRQFKEQLGNRQLYIHGSYWFNLAQLSKYGFSLLKTEIKHAKQLGAQHLILHPGSGDPTQSHEQNIDTLAGTINRLLELDKDIIFVLENTAHAHQTIGSNFEDFYILKQKLNNLDRIRFCIDTAHAYAYGYDITTPDAQNKFIDLVHTTIGLDLVQLIHLNDATYQQGHHIDKHAVLGKGTIGIDALRSFAMHHRLVHIPLILELPHLTQEEDKEILQVVRGWKNF